MRAETGTVRVEHPFESPDASASGHARVAQVAAGLRSGRVERAGALGGDTAPRGDVVGGAVPLPEPLAALLPQGLRRGDVAAVATREGMPTYLALALLAEPLRRGLWGAAVGVPGLGGLALRELMGEQGTAGLRRLLVVPQPGEAWPRVVETLADGVDALLVRPPTTVPAALRRRIEARLRQGRAQDTTHRAVLLVLGDWPGAPVAFRTEKWAWTGLSTAGTGHLTGGLATVTATGRATAGHTRAARLWLPDRDGRVRELTDQSARSAEQPPGPLRVVA